ncbi:hypothetical protein FHS18_002799 [Paenibacillus phyllosphaerae]|uniref:Uncharacterized protein n=1 Tax=Paenibacillus phyllosphaerae TaxID=274593 RepID=A0A7W5AY48_9BACL|nr:hypothetical protein [Paenibacillus phyllosphaerae]
MIAAYKDVFAAAVEKAVCGMAAKEAAGNAANAALEM